MKPWVVAITGASGAVYGVRLVQCLADSGQRIALIISDAGRLVLREETGSAFDGPVPSPEALAEIFGTERVKAIQAYSPDDLYAPVASGSYPVSGMVVAPCSMSTLGAVSSGAGRNLVHRAADCAVKEGRRLVLVPRETPLSIIHLENMVRLARAGVRIVPAMPAFYPGVTRAEDMILFMAGKILDAMELPHALYPRWTGVRQEFSPGGREGGAP